MSETSLDKMKTEQHNLEEMIALGLYKQRKEKIFETIDRILEKHGGKQKSIEEIRENLSEIDGSMSEYIISERE